MTLDASDHLQTLIHVLTRDHAGRAAGIHARQLAAKVGVNERRLRQLITYARFDGQPICGTPGTGYYLAHDESELAESAQWWRARALHSLQMAARVLRISMPALLGQMQLQAQADQAADPGTEARPC